MNKNNKKPLPYSATKSELIQMYCDQFSEAKIRKQINEILNERNISKDTKIIPHLEFMEFVETYGLPKGYHYENYD
jgi:predicted component of type VI protein secretion system